MQGHHSIEDATTERRTTNDATRPTMQRPKKRAVVRRGVGTCIYPRLTPKRRRILTWWKSTNHCFSYKRIEYYNDDDDNDDDNDDDDNNDDDNDEY